MAVFFLCLGYAGGAFKESTTVEFLFQKDHSIQKNGVVRYLALDKAYINNYVLEAHDLILQPLALYNSTQDAEKENNSKIKTPNSNSSSKLSSNSSKKSIESKEREYLGIAQSLRIKLQLKNRDPSVYYSLNTQRHFYPRIDPLSAQVQRTSTGESNYTPTSKPSIFSKYWKEDLYLQLGSIYDPEKKENLRLNFKYELYTTRYDQNPIAYDLLFPSFLVAYVDVWINPLVKFIWLGTLLFILSGLLVWLPIQRKGSSHGYTRKTKT